MTKKAQLSEISIKIAQANPFDDAFICDIDDLKRIYADEFSDLVRSENPNIRNAITSGKYRNNPYPTPYYQDDMLTYDKLKDENIYLDTHDKSYVRGEFDQPEDSARFDDEERVLMRNLELKQMQDREKGKITDISELELDADGETEYTPEDDEASISDFKEIDADSNKEGDDDQKQIDTKTKYDGIVRSVKGAYLVSKEKQPDGTFTEVWIYNVGEKYENERNIRSSILAGTDIDPKTNRSEDGSQIADFHTIGNIQFLTIDGLYD